MNGGSDREDQDFVANSDDWDAVKGRASTDSIQRQLAALIQAELRRVAVPLTQLGLVATALVIWLSYPLLFPAILRQHQEVVTLVLLLACAVTVIRGSLRSWVMTAVVITILALAWVLGIDVPTLWYRWVAFFGLIGIISFALSPNFR